ncbi:putative membrane protein [Methanonatronarchaeum thermophilum]|uniref:Putative membrane protein n=1 Tax=Methanonatronarchaeum thermophilum TaxID=1927129 RepID=A0A1Y3GAL6_9EURY|nr:hypothetical protein [Methanonatronarchaeum thermophilum]OUJ18501.1 putative membrane protein [Methanonatronarchaeum thermophilum]
MGIFRKILVVLLAFLLVVGFAFTASAITAERTVLNSDFVKDTIDNEELHVSIHSEFISILEDEMDEEDEEELPQEMIDILGKTISADFIRDVMHKNIDLAYEYIDGDRDELIFEIDVDDFESNFELEFEKYLLNSSMTEITELLPGNGGMEDLEELHEYNGVVYNISMIDRMLESEESYNEVVDEYRSDLAAIVGEENVDDVIQENIDEIRDEVEGDFDGDAEEEAFVNAYVDMMVTPLESIGNEDSYSVFLDNMEDNKSEFSSEFTNAFIGQITEDMPTEINLTDEMDEDDVGLVEDARNLLQLSWIAILVGVIGILVFTGLIWLVSGSLITTAYSAGAAALISGLIGISSYFTAPMVLDRFRNELGEDAPEVLIDGIEAFVTNIVEVQTIISILILMLAVVLLGVGIYLARKNNDEAK